jgi:hypothetical protein
MPNNNNGSNVGEEEDDDYMSMAFLEEASKVTQTKNLTYSQRRQQEMQRQRQKGNVKSLKERGEFFF